MKLTSRRASTSRTAARRTALDNLPHPYPDTRRQVDENRRHLLAQGAMPRPSVIPSAIALVGGVGSVANLVIHRPDGGLAGSLVPIGAWAATEATVAAIALTLIGRAYRGRDAGRALPAVMDVLAVLAVLLSWSVLGVDITRPDPADPKLMLGAVLPLAMAIGSHMAFLDVRQQVADEIRETWRARRDDQVRTMTRAQRFLEQSERETDPDRKRELWDRYRDLVDELALTGDAPLPDVSATILERLEASVIDRAVPSLDLAPALPPVPAPEAAPALPPAPPSALPSPRAEEPSLVDVSTTQPPREGPPFPKEEVFFASRKTGEGEGDPTQQGLQDDAQEALQAATQAPKDDDRGDDPDDGQDALQDDQDDDTDDDPAHPPRRQPKFTDDQLYLAGRKVFTEMDPPRSLNGFISHMRDQGFTGKYDRMSRVYGRLQEEFEDSGADNGAGAQL